MKRLRLYPPILLYLVLFLLIIMIVFLMQGRLYMSDFKVYYGAANDLWQWSISAPGFGEGTEITGKVYDKAYGLPSGFFKYAPVTMFFFTPLAALPFNLASITYFCICIFVITWCVYRSHELMREFKGSSAFFSRPNLAIGLLGLVLGQNLYRELWLGNVNAILLALSLLAIICSVNRARKWSGLFLGLAIVLKPHFLVLLPFFIIRKRFIESLWAVGTIAALLFLPLVILGFERGEQLTLGWFKAMSAHNSTELLTTHRYTIYRFVYALFSFQPGSMKGVALTLGFISTVFFLFHFFFVKIQRRLSELEAEAFDNKTFIFLAMVILALLPNITLTDFEHFLYGMPLIAFVLMYLFDNTNKFNLALLVVVFIAYGGNWPDVVGRSTAHSWEEAGLLGIANLVIVLTALYLFVVYQLPPRKTAT